MTTKQAFTSSEWDQILMGPPSAGVIVIVAQKGGMFRETLAIGKTYAEARQHHGQSELLDEIVAEKPEIDHTRYGSLEEVRDRALQHLRDALSPLDAKATEQERSDYRAFVVTLAERVASAHREGGKEQDPVSDPEREAIDSIRSVLG
jgi:hypothetical protein